MVDALASGASVRMDVEVRVLFWAPMGKDLHRQKMPTEVVQQVYTGKLKPDVLTLAMTLDQYEAYKSDTPKAAREIGQRIERLRTDMKSVFGKQRLKYTPLTEITRTGCQ